MNPLTANIRKAAVLLHSVDADTAAALLQRLSPAEAEAIRTAVRSLGSIDDEEQQDVAAEFRCVGPVMAETPDRGVELDFSPAGSSDRAELQEPAARPPGGRPFQFLEQARIESLVPYLAREHEQTVAVVLSYLPPQRAADVLAALPAWLQAQTVERLAMLGETDPDSLQVIERELAEWLARQQAAGPREGKRSDVASAILAAASDSAREKILANVDRVNHSLARRYKLSRPVDRTQPLERAACPSPRSASSGHAVAGSQGRSAAPPSALPAAEAPALASRRAPSPTPAHPARPAISFDSLVELDDAVLAALLRAVDAEIWVLALAGASDRFVKRITQQMPRSTAKTFRQRLHQLGPTRLRDVEAAQAELAIAATQRMP